MTGQYEAYTTSRANTMSKVGLIVMLYEGAIRFLSLAVYNMKEKKFYEKAKYINKASKIIEELQNSLDFEKGGEISNNLNKLYSFFLSEISSAGIKNNCESLQKIMNLLTDMKKSWEQIEKQQVEPLQVNDGYVENLRVSG